MGLDDWSRTAELVHGIGFEDCVTQGLPVREAAVRFNLALNGRLLYSDARDYDGYWLQRLYEAASMQPTFSLKLLPLEPLLRDTLRTQGRVAAQHPRTHRAEADARHMAAMHRSVLGLDP